MCSNLSSRVDSGATLGRDDFSKMGGRESVTTQKPQFVQIIGAFFDLI